MATTDSRTGFRLPWSTDRSASREASVETAQDDAATTAEAVGAPSPDSSPIPFQGAAGDAAHLDQEDPVRTIAPEAAQHPSTWSPAGLDPAHAPAGGAAWASPPAPARRPTKFLADLTRAMQAAAEQSRAATLEQFRTDGTAVIEQIHASSATGGEQLRRRADEDVAAIKDWSKAEVARIREETERRVAARREQLEGQLERHAALIEHEIEKVRGRIVEFEAAMGRFFEELLAEDDPGEFAALAASMPEPPHFAVLDDDAMAALLREPGVGLPAPEVPVAAPEPPMAVAEVPMAAAEVPATVPEPALETAGEEPVVAAEAIAAVDNTPAGAEPAEGTLPAGTTAGFDREAAMAAIEAAAEAAEAVEAAGIQADRAEAAADRAEAVASADSLPAWAYGGRPDGQPTPDVEPAPVVEAAVEATPDVEPEPAVEAAIEAEPDVHVEPAPEGDPRLAMLGLTPDFAAAEVEAAEAAAASVDEIPEIGGDALAARLDGLVGVDEPAEPGPRTTTQVVVTGLVSVASIASFKRHVGRLPGVGHVGVSSGPDGEFVFAVEHDAATALRDLVPTLPGFGARVVGGGEGTISVSAQDPQD